MRRRHVLSGFAAAAIAAALASDAGAQTYPAQPVKVIVPIGVGGSYDFVGRLLANELSEKLGVGFIVENRTGSGTVIGTQAAAMAPPDGYTLLVGGLSNIVFNAPLYQKLPYDPMADFTPIALVYNFPYILVARKDLPYSSLPDLIAAAKKDPNSVSVATLGPGSGQQIIGAAFMKDSGVKLVEVPYRGAQAAYPDLLSGRVDMFFDSASAALPYVTSGQVKPIALIGPRRLPSLPSLATAKEQGQPNLAFDSWIGLFAPAKTPPAVLDRLRQATRDVAPRLKERFEQSGGELMEIAPKETETFVKAEFERWNKIIRDAGIRLD